MTTYKESDGYENTMQHLNKMESLNYTLYHNSSEMDASATAVYVKEDVFNIKNEGSMANQDKIIVLKNGNNSVINSHMCEKTENGYDLSNCGLLYNAAGSIDNIEAFNVSSVYKDIDGPVSIPYADYKKTASTSFENNCKKHKGQHHCDACDLISHNMCDIMKENYRNNTDTMVTYINKSDVQKTVSLLEWLNTPAREFKDECKRYDTMPEGACALCFNDGNLSSECPQMTNLGVEMANELQSVMAQEQAAQDAAAAETQAEMNQFSEPFQCFYNRYRQPLNNYVREMPIMPTYAVKVEKEVTTLHMENDVLTSVYLGSISVLGLYILYRLME